MSARMAWLDRLGRREKWGLLAAAVVALLFVVDLGVVRRVRAAVMNLDAATVTAREQLRYARSVQAVEPAINVEYQRMRDWLDASSDETEAMTVLKARVDELAQAHGVTLLSMEDRKPVAREHGFSELTLRVPEFESSLRALLSFLAAIEQARGFMTVTGITLQPRADGAGVRGELIISKTVVTGT